MEKVIKLPAIRFADAVEVPQKHIYSGILPVFLTQCRNVFMHILKIKRDFKLPLRTQKSVDHVPNDSYTGKI